MYCYNLLLVTLFFYANTYFLFFYLLYAKKLAYKIYFTINNIYESEDNKKFL